jgi:hypothetical protein
MDAGVTKIEDPSERDSVRRQARRVHLRSAIAAVVFTLAAIAIG